MYLKKQELTFQTEKLYPEELQPIIDKEREKGFSLTRRDVFTVDATDKVYNEIVLVFERP